MTLETMLRENELNITGQIAAASGRESRCEQQSTNEADRVRPQTHSELGRDRARASFKVFPVRCDLRISATPRRART